MRLGLIFSNDWELFGDGSGDFWEIQHRRLRQMLDVAAQFNAPITVMAEVAQQWAHRRLAARESWACEIADAWESILVAAVREGSDVQLHLHPQWLDARPCDGKWQLNFERWALSSLDRRAIADSLARGKQYLESLLRPVRPQYRTVLFRAGAFCIEPAANAIGALAEAGFLADSSVTKGLYDSRYYDYRRAPSRVLPWQVDIESVARAGERSGIVELPIMATRVWDSPLLRRWSNWHFTRALTNDDRKYLADRAAYVDAQYPSAQRPATLVGHGWKRLVARWSGLVLRRHTISLDYDVLPAGVFVDCVERLLHDAELKSVAEPDTIVPVVALGHSKLVPDAGNLARVLSQLTARLGDRIVYWTGQEAVEYWSARLKARATRDRAA